MILCSHWWNKNGRCRVTPTRGRLLCRMQFVQTYAEASPNLNDRPSAWFFIRRYYLCSQAKRHMLRCLQPKIQVRKLTLYNKCAKANTYTHTNTHTRHSQEMRLIHFVGCNRTNFGREPLLMSWSLMCKSSSPRAKLIRSPHNPAQVQSCSLLHYLSCPPNNIRPHTANKSTSKTEKTCKFVKQTR